MPTHISKKAENDKQDVTNNSSGKDTNPNVTRTMDDRRFEATKISDLPKVISGSNQIQQIKSASHIANNSPQVMQKTQLQTMVANHSRQKTNSLVSTSNQTKLPDTLKVGIEKLSGLSMDHVNVNYNSQQPAGLNAHAFAQGSEIHLASGQEKHLAHEAWHVVQQAQGRVQPTLQLKGSVAINDDIALEKEADEMGTLALVSGRDLYLNAASNKTFLPNTQGNQPVQRTVFNMGDDEKLATKDGELLSKRLKQEYVKIPIPELADKNGMLVAAVSPFVVMFHGSTLQILGAIGFRDTLIEKGYPRSKGLELVLITCSADSILGTKDAQMLSNALQSKVRAAKGKVVVNQYGIPCVTIKGTGQEADTIDDTDIFSLTEKFEDFADGWTLYTPQPSKTLKFIELDAFRQKFRVSQLLKMAEKLMAVKQLSHSPELAVEFHRRAVALQFRITDNISDARKFEKNASNENMLLYRAATDQLLIEIEQSEDEGKLMEAAWEKKNGKTIERHLRKLELEDEKSSQLVFEEAGDGWDIDSIDFESVEDEAIPTTSNTLRTATDGGGKDVTSLKAKDNVPLSNSVVIQRFITAPDEAILDGRKLLSLTTGFSDINLVQGNEMALDIKFGDTDENHYAVTRLLIANQVVIPFEALIVKNKQKEFKIEITLSNAIFDNGKKELPQLIATLIHEWELHGRQHALNIHKLKNDMLPDIYYGHAHIFADKTQDMDRVMAAGIDEARGEDRGSVLLNYLNDAEAHRKFVSRGWEENDNENAVQLQTALVNLRSSWRILSQIKSNGNKYDERISSFLAKLEDFFFDKPDATANGDGLLFLFNKPKEWYPTLIASFSENILDDNLIYVASREQFKINIREVLMWWSNFIDYAAHKEDEESTPRKAAMSKLGHPPK
ncbi:MAG: DUF4157 domain-containing protein [Flavobacteriales bacterium]